MTPIEFYELNVTQCAGVWDPAQERAVRLLQAVYEDLIRAEASGPGLMGRLLGRHRQVKPVKGLYLWGGVGRGKTWIVDQFFECLPFGRKKRTHFHRFMRKVHEQLKRSRHLPDPLAGIASVFARDFRVLCFDEFIVNDIADAMILAGLLKHLFDHGVTLVATSNFAPDDLYKDGLQRDRFQPAVDLIAAHATVHEIGGRTDYRLQFLHRANIYFHPHDNMAVAGLQNNFERISSEPAHNGGSLEIDGRVIRTIRHAAGIAWFDYREICDGPRSQNDYIELARCFHTVVVSDIPAMCSDSDDAARRFINLIDILYDANVKFMGSGCCPPEQLYRGKRLRHEFTRTVSRLFEMRSGDYLARQHLYTPS